MFPPINHTKDWHDNLNFALQVKPNGDEVLYRCKCLECGGTSAEFDRSAFPDQGEPEPSNIIHLPKNE